MIQDTSAKVDPNVFLEKFMNKDNINEVWELAKSSKLNSIRNRLTSWRLFLGIFKVDESVVDWRNTLEISRMGYLMLRPQHLIDDQVLMEKLQSSESLIQLKINIQELYEVLKIWLGAYACEFNEEMIDILGIILHVVNSEKYSEPEGNNFLKSLNDPQYVTNDSYQIFSEVMKIGYLPLHSKTKPIKKQKEKTILTLKCERSYHYYLKSLDPELYNFLEFHSVPVEKYLS